MLCPNSCNLWCRVKWNVGAKRRLQIVRRRSSRHRKRVRVSAGSPYCEALALRMYIPISMPQQTWQNIYVCICCLCAVVYMDMVVVGTHHLLASFRLLKLMRMFVSWWIVLPNALSYCLNCSFHVLFGGWYEKLLKVRWTKICKMCVCALSVIPKESFVVGMLA